MILVELLDADVDVRHAAVDVRHAGTQLRHPVAVFHPLAGQVVQAVEILFVAGNAYLALRVLHRDDRFEEHPLPVLDILAHRVQVGGEDDRSREDALAVFALALAEKLLEPLAQILHLRVEAGEKFDFLALGVEQVAHGGVADGRIVSRAVGKRLFSILRAADHGFDVKTGQGDGHQADRRQHGKAAADVVLDDEGLVTLLVRERLEGSADLVGDGHDAAAGFLFAVGVFQMLLDQTEGHGRFGGGAALGDDHAGSVARLQQIQQFGRIILRQVLAGEDHFRSLEPQQGGETVAERLDGGFCAEIRSTDADDHHQIDFLFNPAVHHAQAVVQLLFSDGRRQMLPAQEIIAGTRLVFQYLLGRERLFHIFFETFLSHEGIASA